AAEPNSLEALRFLARALLGTALALSGAGRRMEAVPVLEEVLDLRAKIAARPDSTPEDQFELGVAHEEIGEIAHATRDVLKAHKEFSAKHEIASQLHQNDPENPRWKRDLFVSSIKMGDSHRLLQ